MSRQVAEKIALEIAESGPISFARFMELALYCPEYGYYEKEGDRIGREGDFYTSVSVGSLFGELLAFQFAHWLCGASPGDQTGQAGDMGLLNSGHVACMEPGTAVIAEAGAHKGELARDILSSLRQFCPELFHRLLYIIVEPSSSRTGWQKQTLSGFNEQVRWATDLSELAPQPPKGPGAGFSPGVAGIIFSNELLDSMPVHRLGWDKRRQAWFEWGVTLADAGFAWKRMKRTVPPPAVPAGMLSVLPDGFIFETCPRAEAWYRQAAALLAKGTLLTIDYGLSEPELLVPERPGGTLRAYAHHQAKSDLLGAPGEQDLTAHVNFSVIEQAGLATGLETVAHLPQEQFLTRIAAEAMRSPSGFPLWTPLRLSQFRTLTHPGHLGRVFRALVQSR